jgi:hypothetical protein
MHKKRLKLNQAKTRWWIAKTFVPGEIIEITLINADAIKHQTVNNECEHRNEL